jgi:hypothetical protein
MAYGLRRLETPSDSDNRLKRKVVNVDRRTALSPPVHSGRRGGNEQKCSGDFGFETSVTILSCRSCVSTSSNKENTLGSAAQCRDEVVVAEGVGFAPLALGAYLFRNATETQPRSIPYQRVASPSPSSVVRFENHL